MVRYELEEVLNKDVEPVIDEAMKKYLGARISEIRGEISDKLLNSPLIGLRIDFTLNFKDAKKQFKKDFLRKLLQIHHGNISEVARLCGIDRRSIHRLVEKKKSQKIRKDLVKPYYLKQKEIENIIENVLDNYKSIIREENIERFYNATPEISEKITEILPDSDISLKEAEEEFERVYLTYKMNIFNNNVVKTAREIGIRRETLIRKLKKLGIDY